MRRRSGVLLLAGVVTVIVLAAGVSAGAAPSNVQPPQTKVEAAQARLAGLRGQTGAAYESYNNALFELNQLDDKIASTKKSRASAQKDVDSARKSLQDQAAQMYKSGNVGFMDAIVGARSFSEFTGRLNLWIQLLQQDRAKLARFREARDNLARQEKALESQRKQRVASLNSAVADKENATRLQSQAQSYLGSLDKNLAQAIQAEQARRAELARQAAARAAANVQAAPSVAVAQPIQVPKLAKTAPKTTPSKATSAPQSAPAPETIAAPEATTIPQPTPAPEAATSSPETAPPTRPAPTPQVEPAVVSTKVDNSAAIEKANRLARLAAQQAEAKKKAADQAAARQRAAEKEAARIAAKKQANAEQAAAAEKARRDAEAAARRAAVEKAAADRKAAEQEAAKKAAERAAELAAVRRDQIAARKAATEQERQQTIVQQAAEQQPATVSSPATTTEATVPQETTTVPQETTTVPEETTTLPETTQALTQTTVPTPPQTTPATTTPATTAPEATVPSPPPATTTEAPAPQPVATSPGSGSGSSVVAEAQTWLGVPYVWGGASRSGVDCSGLTMLVFAQFGISLPHSAAAQDGYGSPGSGAAGDLVFGDFQGTGAITHVGISTGDGQMINAPYPGTVVRYDPIYPQYTLDYRTLL